MAIIQHLELFSWKDFHNNLQNLGDLERFKLVIETMPDQKLIQILRNFSNILNSFCVIKSIPFSHLEGTYPPQKFSE